jgi:hypothetical protein
LVIDVGKSAGDGISAVPLVELHAAHRACFPDELFAQKETDLFSDALAVDAGDPAEVRHWIIEFSALDKDANESAVGVVVEEFGERCWSCISVHKRNLIRYGTSLRVFNTFANGTVYLWSFLGYNVFPMEVTHATIQQEDYYDDLVVKRPPR